MTDGQAQKAVEQITARIKPSAHGHPGDGLSLLSEFLQKLKKRKRPFLSSRLFQEPKSWEMNVARKIWPSETVAAQNRYPFLQGDILRSEDVFGPSSREDYRGPWLVLSVDCDCAREGDDGETQYYSLAKIVVATKSQDNLATTFLTHKLFPIPPVDRGRFPDLDPHENWWVADLTVPYHIRRNLAFLQTTVVKSIQVDAWHILNAVLQQRCTRSLDMDESEKLRS